MVWLLAALLALGSVGCGDVLDRVDELRGDAEQVTDRARFCLALTRTIAAIESGSPDTAAEAAEEALATAPTDITEDARLVVEGVRQSLDGGDDALDDPALHDAADRLQQRTRELCDPTS